MWTWARARPCPSPPPVPAWMGQEKEVPFWPEAWVGLPPQSQAWQQALWAHAVIQQTGTECLRRSGHMHMRARGPERRSAAGEGSSKLRPSNEKELAKWGG